MAAVIHSPTTLSPPSLSPSAASLSLSPPPPTLLFLSNTPKPSSPKTQLLLLLSLRLRLRSSAAQSLAPPPPPPPPLAGAAQFDPPPHEPLREPPDWYEQCTELLRLSVQYDDVGLARAVHASFLRSGGGAALGNALASSYLRLGLGRDARRVLSGLASPDATSFSTLITGLARSRREREAARVFAGMMSSGAELDGYVLVAVLTACSRIAMLRLGSQVHGLVSKLGDLGSVRVRVSNALMSLYSNCGRYDDARKVFDEMPERSFVSYNTMLSSFVKGSMFDRAFDLFRDMQGLDGFEFDHFTLSPLLIACTATVSASRGRELHGFAIKRGLGRNLDLNNTLLGFYMKCGDLKDAVTLFDSMPSRDVITSTEMVRACMEFGAVDLAEELFDCSLNKNDITYSVLLDGYCQNGEGRRALALFIEMVEDGADLSEPTIISVVSACGLIGNDEISNQIQAFVLKSGFGSNRQIQSALLDMCTKCGRMEDAETMFFNLFPYHRDRTMDWTIDWTSMLSGYTLHGWMEEAVDLFHDLQIKEGVSVTIDFNPVVATTILGACGKLVLHKMGRQIHCCALKHGWPVSDLRLGNALVSMYAKCGNMDDALRVFRSMPVHHAVSLNCLISGYILHRRGDEALAVRARIDETGVKLKIKPDALTLVLLVSAYRYTSVDLVSDCRKLFFSMETKYGIEPNSDHYASLVSVLGFWGYLEEAEETIDSMPFEPSPFIYRSLLNSCRIHLNIKLGKKIARRILAMKPRDPSTYILAANLYAVSGRFLHSESVREAMREKGIHKNPTRSWVVSEDTVHLFYARDQSHPLTESIYSKLDRLIQECVKVGYAPDMSFVLQDVEEVQKKVFLFCHSAKLAASYGLLVTEPGKPVRVAKNVRLCGDCHSFLRSVSLVSGRVIVFRDGSGFHRFSDGECSCNDMW